MNLTYKLVLTFSCIVLFIRCDKKTAKNENTLPESENTVLLNNETAIKREAEIAIKKILDIDLVFSKISILSQHIAIRDLDYDDLPDVLVFLGYKNTQDNSFYKSKILFFKNDGKQLILTDTASHLEKYIIPSQDKSFYSSRGDGVIVEKFIPDAFGRIPNSFSSRGIVIYLENKLLLDYVSENDVKFTYTISDEIKYVSAQKGLLCRDQPGKKGEIIHKFSYGEEVNIIGVTDKELTLYDEDLYENITDYWVMVKLDVSSTYAKKGYVFSGYLVEDRPN